MSLGLVWNPCKANNTFFKKTQKGLWIYLASFNFKMIFFIGKIRNYIFKKGEANTTSQKG